MGLFDRLKSGLGKTRGGFTSRIGSLLTGRKIDEDLFDELEEALIEADLGISTAMKLMDTLRDRVETEKIKDSDKLKDILIEEIETVSNDIDLVGNRYDRFRNIGAGAVVKE